MKVEKNSEDLPAPKSQNREQGAIKYEEIRFKLINIFVWRGASCPEKMADETINRALNHALDLATPSSEEKESATLLASSRLDALKKKRFSPEGRAERIARSLAALDQVAAIHLTPEEWRQIAEDPDIEDQF